jgi:hypothetical protein
MKLITLNAWGGRIYEPQMQFLKKHIGTTDIFCLQEVYNGQKNINTQNGFVENMFSQYSEIFKDYEGFYAESLMHNLGEETIPYGIAIFYKSHGEFIGPYGNLTFSKSKIAQSKKDGTLRKLQNYILQNLRNWRISNSTVADKNN